MDGCNSSVRQENSDIYAWCKCSRLSLNNVAVFVVSRALVVDVVAVLVLLQPQPPLLLLLLFLPLFVARQLRIHG